MRYYYTDTVCLLPRNVLMSLVSNAVRKRDGGTFNPEPRNCFDPLGWVIVAVRKDKESVKVVKLCWDLKVIVVSNKDRITLQS